MGNSQTAVFTFHLNSLNRLIAAKAISGFGDGFVSLLLPVYLLILG